MLRVFVTGATGCVGRATVAEALGTGWLVRGMARSSPPAWWPIDAEYLRGSVEDRDAVRRGASGCSAVVHLGAPAHDWLGTQATMRSLSRATVDGSVNAAVAARGEGAQFVLVSTVGVYGTPTPSPVDETTPVAPHTAYAMAKLLAEERCQQIVADATVLRCAVVYGPGDRGNVARLIDAIARGRGFVVGAGTNRKSLLFSQNLADRILKCLGIRTQGLWCVADRPPLTQQEIAEKIARLLGKPTPRAVPEVLALTAARALDGLAMLSGSNQSHWSARVRSLKAETVVDGTALDRALDYVERVSADEALRLASAASVTTGSRVDA